MKLKAEHKRSFSKNYAKYCKLDKKLEKDFDVLYNLILEGLPLPKKYKDHKLKGDMQGMHDSHLRFDLVII